MLLRAPNWPGDYGLSVGTLLSGGVQTLLISLVTASQTVDLSNLGIYNVHAYGVKGDGVTDDAANIQAAVTAASPNGSLFFLPNKTYYLGSAVSFTGYTGQIIDWGATFTGPGASSIPGSGSSGYVRLGLGLTLQWGTFTIPTDNSSKAVAFPIAFTTAVKSLTLGVQDTGVNALTPQFTNPTTTGFSATCGGGTAGDTATVNYMVIGT